MIKILYDLNSQLLHSYTRKLMLNLWPLMHIFYDNGISGHRIGCLIQLHKNKVITN